MTSEAAVPPGSQPDGQGTPFESGRDQTSQNIETVLDFYTREEQKISRSQRILERISNLVGQPVFLGFILLFTRVEIQDGLDILAGLVAAGFEWRALAVRLRPRRNGSLRFH